jgi:hypothetical protein
MEDIIYCLNACWSCNKNHDIIGVCQYRSFCGAMSKSDAREILFEEIEQGVQNQGEEEHAHRTELSDGTSIREGALMWPLVCTEEEAWSYMAL